MINDLAPELSRRIRGGAYKSIEDVLKRTKNIRLRAHLFDSTVLPALRALRKQDERTLNVTQRAIEKAMLGASRITLVREGIRSSELRQRSKIRDASAYAKISKIRWAGNFMRFNDDRWTTAVSGWVPQDMKRTAGRPPNRWSDLFTKGLEKRYDAHRVPRASRAHWATLARDRDKWKFYWCPLESLDDPREHR